MIVYCLVHCVQVLVDVLVMVLKVKDLCNQRVELNLG